VAKKTHRALINPYGHPNKASNEAVLHEEREEYPVPAIKRLIEKLAYRGHVAADGDEVGQA
jgi:hypothetical protein